MFIFAWNVYALVIISSFAGNLEAYLMIADDEKPVDSTKDIVEQVLTIGMGGFRAFFTTRVLSINEF